MADIILIIMMFVIFGFGLFGVRRFGKLMDEIARNSAKNLSRDEDEHGVISSMILGSWIPGHPEGPGRGKEYDFWQ